MNRMKRWNGKASRGAAIGIAIGVLVLVLAVVQVAAMPTGPFTLTYTAGPNGYLTGTTSQSVEIFQDGTPVEAFGYIGYHFTAWSDGSTENPRTDTAVTNNVTVTAYFAIDRLTVEYGTDGNGTISGTTPQTVDFGSDTTEVEAVPNEGYHFLIWSDEETANPRTDLDVRESFSVTAYFEIDSFTLEYIAGDHGYVEGDTTQTVDYRDDGTAVTAVPYSDYHFVDWSDGSLDNPRTDLCVTENLSVTANFAIDTFTLDYAAGDNGTLSGDVDQVVEIWSDGTAVTAVPDPGYLFVAWSDGSTENPRTDVDVWANVDVTATFSLACAVTFDSRGGSAVDAQDVPAGCMLSYPAPPTKTGAYFAGWYKESACENRWSTHVDLVTEDVTLYAKWVASAPRIAVFCDMWGSDVREKLLCTGFFSCVDVYSLTATPTLSLLEQYHCVLVYTCGGAFGDVVAWGDVLADYSDEGYGVVMAMFTQCPAGTDIGIEGRLATGGYLPLTQAATDYGSDLTLVLDALSSPILNGVASFDGGTSSYHSAVSLTSGATLVAHWSDGCPMVATKQASAGRVVSLNLFPPSDACRSDFWDATTDGAYLLSNSLAWAATTGTVLAPPAITSDGGDATAYVYANENRTDVTTVTATDPDSATLTYSIVGGNDAARFTIDATTGVLTFLTAPDYENPGSYYRTNTYEVVVQVSDGGLTDTQSLSVIVQDSPYDPPRITSDGAGSEASVSVKEGTTYVTTVTATDQENHALTLSIAGGSDAALFALDPATGILTFLAAPDYETMLDADANGIYDLILYVCNDVYSDSQVLHVTVTAVTATDLVNDLRAYVDDLQTAGTISNSVASGLDRTLAKVNAKIAAGDIAGAKKLLNGLITTIDRATPRKIPAIESAELIDRIRAAILKLG